MKSKLDQKISVIGLGQMGTRIAQLYPEAGFNVSVWNRNPEKAEGLVYVNHVANLDDAIQENALHIICVYDNAAVMEILKSLNDKDKLNGKAIINLTTGSPDEVSRLNEFINEYQGLYLNGAIQVAPDQMGLKETTILFGGNSAVYNHWLESLKVLGGNLRYLGENPSTSSAMDLATLTVVYGSYMGVIYGVKLCQAFGLKLEDYAAIIEEISPGFTAFYKHEIGRIDEDNFDVTQSPLEISVLATKRIADTFSGLPVAQEFPKTIASILQLANKQYGMSGKEVAIISKVIDA